MRIYYWKSATGDLSLLETHGDAISRILGGSYNSNDLEKLRHTSTYPVYSFRLNQKDRLLFTTYKNCLHVLEFLPNHDYQKSRFLKHGVLHHAMATFTALSAEEPRPVFENDDSPREDVPLEFYNQQFISLNEKQLGATRAPLPAVVLGGAGTGKTLVGLSCLSGQMAAKKNLLYVSKTSRLVEAMQKQWSEGFVVAADCVVDFRTYDHLVCSEPAGIVGEPEFSAWFPGNSTLMDAKSCYAECFICSGFTQEQYLKLGTRQSCIVDLATKTEFYTQIFMKYCDFLASRNLFDPALSSVTVDLN